MPKTQLGRKLAHWLAEQKASGLDPHTPTAFARAIGVDQKTVWGWIEKGVRPRSDMVAKVARVTGIDAMWLMEDSESWPPPPEARGLDDALAGLTAEERSAVLAALRDPGMRQALIAFGAARADGAGARRSGGTPR